VRFLGFLIAGYRRFATPASDLSLCTAAALLAVAGVASLVDAYVASWNVGLGLLWISGFYFAVALHSLWCQSQDHRVTPEDESRDTSVTKPSAGARYAVKPMMLRRSARLPANDAKKAS
jgi:hypothetical protein